MKKLYFYTILFSIFIFIWVGSNQPQRMILICKEKNCVYTEFNLLNNEMTRRILFENLTETQFEDLVEACYGTKSGEIHGEPSDWILLKSKNDNLCYVISAEGDSINDVTELISEKLKQKFTKDNAKKTNLIWSLEKQDSDSLTMSDVATSINKISEGIEAGTEIEVELWYNFQNKNLVKKYKLVCVFSFI